MAPTSDNGRQLSRLLSGADADFRAAFLRVVAATVSQHTLGQVADLIERGQADAAVRALGPAAGALATTWAKWYVEAGTTTAGFVGRATAQVGVHFGGTNARAVDLVRANQLRLVREFTEEQRAATRQALVRGVAAGANPVEQARAFRQSIGLTRYQEQAVENYRQALQSGGTSALDRELRDRRFDRTVESAAADGRSLSSSQVENMVGRYRERFIAYRAESIARTESLSSVHEGMQEAFSQAADNGAIQSADVERTWSTSEDNRVRDSHDAMDGQVRGLDEPFESGDGNQLMYPGDPAAPPEDRVNCRCNVSYRLTGPALDQGETITIEQSQD